jgi:hypothetical protein
VVALLGDENSGPVRLDQLLNPCPEATEWDVVLSGTCYHTSHTAITLVDINQHRIPLTGLDMRTAETAGSITSAETAPRKPRLDISVIT